MISRRHLKSCAPALFAPGFFLGVILNLILLVPPNSHAHGPFDNSVHAILQSDALEVSVVLGGEAAREILNRAAPKNTAALGGMGLKTLPPELAGHFIETKSGATTLSANRFTVVGDGLEYTFTATYPSPDGNSLAFRAPYFEMMEQMKPGTFVLTDASRKQIGSGLFTKTNAAVEVALTRPTPSIPAVTEVAAPQPTTTKSSTTSPIVAAETPPQTPRSSFSRILMIGILALGGIWLGQRLLAKPEPQK